MARRKQHNKQKLRKIDASAVEDARREIVEKKKAEKNLSFKIDTVGSKNGLPKAVRKTLEKEKKVKGGHKLSSHELLKMEKARLRIDRREAHKAGDVGPKAATIVTAATKAALHAAAPKEQAKIEEPKPAPEANRQKARRKNLKKKAATMIVAPEMREQRDELDLWTIAPSEMRQGKTYTAEKHPNLPWLDDKQLAAVAVEKSADGEVLQEVAGRQTVLDTKFASIFKSKPWHARLQRKMAKKGGAEQKDISKKVSKGSFREEDFAGKKVAADDLKPKTAPKTLKMDKIKTCRAPSVVLPGNELSVNPGASVHDDFMAGVLAEDNMQQQADADAHERAYRPMTAKLLEAFTREELKAMGEGERLAEYRKLIFTHVEDAAGGKKKGGAAAPKASTGPADRKTQAQRNKRARNEELEAEQSLAKKQKALDKSVGHVPNLLREMEQEEQARQEKKELVQKYDDEREALEKKGVVVKGRKIGRSRFTEGKKLDDVNLPLQATSSFRAAQVGSALNDRVKSITRRNLIEQPAEINRQTLLRVKKRGKRKERGNKHVQRSLLLN